MSISGNTGRLDGKGGVWRDMLGRCGRGRESSKEGARLLCNNILT